MDGHITIIMIDSKSLCRDALSILNWIFFFFCSLESIVLFHQVICTDSFCSRILNLIQFLSSVWLIDWLYRSNHHYYYIRLLWTAIHQFNFFSFREEKKEKQKRKTTIMMMIMSNKSKLNHKSIHLEFGTTTMNILCTSQKFHKDLCISRRFFYLIDHFFVCLFVYPFV